MVKRLLISGRRLFIIALGEHGVMFTINYAET